MRWRRTAVLVPIGLLSLTVASYAGCKFQERRNEGMRVEAQAKAHALKDQVDARFTVGSSQVETLAALKKTYEGRFIYTGLVEEGLGPLVHYWMVVAEQPSGFWFCDRMAWVTVSADFDAGQFVGTTIQVRPLGCL
jgi:hypothetical protein